MIVVYGLIQIFGGTQMNSKIAETLELMCDRDNPQDRKILLLAELVEHKCDALADNQQKLQKSLDDTNDKLDKLTGLLEKYENDTHGCPVYKNKDSYDKFSFYIRNPKLTILILLGLIALLGGFFGLTITDLVKHIIGL